MKNKTNVYIILLSFLLTALIGYTIGYYSNESYSKAIRSAVVDIVENCRWNANTNNWE